jgi:hypothetical protein
MSLMDAKMPAIVGVGLVCFALGIPVGMVVMGYFAEKPAPQSDGGAANVANPTPTMGPAGGMGGMMGGPGGPGGKTGGKMGGKTGGPGAKTPEAKTPEASPKS